MTGKTKKAEYEGAKAPYDLVKEENIIKVDCIHDFLSFLRKGRARNPLFKKNPFLIVFRESERKPGKRFLIRFLGAKIINVIPFIIKECKKEECRE